MEIRKYAMYVAVIGVFGAVAQAAVDTNTQSINVERTEIIQSVPQTRNEAQGFSDPRIFLGADSGYSSLSTNASNEINTDGYQIDAKLLGSFYFKPAVLDIGGGWLFNRVSGSSQTVRDVSIETRAGFAELSPRLRFGERFQLGPIARLLFGTDMSFASAVLPQKSTATLAGVNFVYDIPYDTTNVRFALQGTTNLNTKERQNYTALLGVQIGFALNKAKTTVVSNPIQKQPDVKITFDKEMVKFKTAKADLMPKAREALREIGEYLAKNPSMFGAVNIDGHADYRGGFDYNLGLSMNRALSVRDVLVSSGISRNKLRTAGYSITQPLADGKAPEALAQNRRVELNFYDVQDPAALKAALEKIKDKLTAESNLP